MSAFRRIHRKANAWRSSCPGRAAALSPAVRRGECQIRQHSHETDVDDLLVRIVVPGVRCPHDARVRRVPVGGYRHHAARHTGGAPWNSVWIRCRAYQPAAEPAEMLHPQRRSWRIRDTKVFGMAVLIAFTGLTAVMNAYEKRCPGTKPAFSSLIVLIVCAHNHANSRRDSLAGPVAAPHRISPKLKPHWDS